jgi:hypothetical protein
MPSIDVKVTSAGTDLRTVARRLRDMSDAKVGELFRRHLADAAAPYPKRVREKVLAIPVKEGGKHTGLRARIALCATVSSGTEARGGWVSVWMDPGKMAPDYKTLPLYMEGGIPKYIRWRHPVYGDRNNWVQQASHPYFYEPVRPLGREAQAAIEAALADVTCGLEA